MFNFIHEKHKQRKEMMSEIFVPPYNFDVRWRLSLLFPGEKKKNFNQDTKKKAQR